MYSLAKCVRVYRKRSTSWLVLDNHARSGSVRRICSMLLRGCCQRSLREIRLRTRLLLVHRRLDLLVVPCSDSGSCAAFVLVRTKSVTTRLDLTYGKMAHLAARVAATATAASAQTQSRAVSLHMSESLAVVALLSCIRCQSQIVFDRLLSVPLTLSGPRMRTVVALVPRLLAVIAQPLAALAHFGIVAYITTLVASTTRKRRHLASVFN